MNRYPSEIEAEMQAFYLSLSEKDRRRYAAIEARKLGHGGQSYLASPLGCHRNTIAAGSAELNDLQRMAQIRIRRPGAGRKPCVDQLQELETASLQALGGHTAGSPSNEVSKWTNLTQQQIAVGLGERGIKVSRTVVKQLLAKHHFVRRKAQGRDSVKKVAHRDERFAKINRLKADYAPTPDPMLSMDTKKRSDRQFLPPRPTLHPGGRQNLRS